jgi:hypothetical protein
MTMIHEICRCPYCRKVCGLDDQAHDLVYARDKPCRHCAFIAVGLDAYLGKRLVTSRSCSLFWVRGTRLQRASAGGAVDPLYHYVLMLATNIIPGCVPLLSDEDLPVGVEYLVAGGTSTEREETLSGSGEFTLTDEHGPTLTASLNGWGIYSRDPDGVMAAVREVVWREVLS